MPQNLKKHGLRSYLSQNQNSKDDGVSKQTSDDTFSPYKNALGQIKRLSLNNDGEDDFSSPKPIKTIPKIFKPPKKTSKKTARAKTSNSVLKRTKDNFKNVDVNAEHLQMALALSKSTFAHEYPEREKETREEDLPSCLSPIKIPKVTTFLEKYGFKSTRNRSNPDFPTNYLEETKKRRNPKFRFVTPILYMRTQEDRECLINTKVSLIISQNKTHLPRKNSVEETYSAELQNYLSDKKCWNLNSCLPQSSEYISPSLELPPPKLTTGCLLKSWEEISGREKSPQKTLPKSKTSLNYDTDIVKEIDALANSPTNNEIKKNQCDNKIPVNNFTTVCSSPDLFASDDESNETSKISECFVAAEENDETNCALSKSAAELSSSKKLIVENEENLSDKSLNTEEINETLEKDSPSTSSKSINKMSVELSTTHQNNFCKPCKPESNKSKRYSKISFSSLTKEVQQKIDSDSSNTDEEIANLLADSYSQSKYFSKAKYLQVTSKSETELSSTRTSEVGSERSLKKFNSFTDSCNIEFEIAQNKSLSKSKMFLDDFSIASRSKSQFLLSEIGLEDVGDLEKPSCSYSKSQDKSSTTQSKSSVSEEQKTENQEMRSKSGIENSKIRSCSSPRASCFELLDKNDKGIEYFESFYDIAEENNRTNVGDSFIDLSQSSDEELPNKISVIYRKISEENCTKMEEELPNFNSSMYQGNTSSLNYNHTKSLNVTDYVMGILNSQEDTNPGEDLQQSQSTSSQESIEISSDEELNYSSRFSAICKNANIYDLDNFDDCIGTDLKAEDLHTIHLDLKTKYRKDKKANDERQKDGTNENLLTEHVITENFSADNNKNDNLDHIDAENLEDCASTQVNNIRENPDRNVEENLEIKTPTQLKDNTQSIFNFQTPSNNLIIKTKDITPMADYDAMDTPKIRKELDKFGIKPLKRRRGVEMLKYIYESTHPIVSMEDFMISNNEAIEEKVVKKRKLNTSFENNEMNTIKIVGTELIQNENEADLLFERKFSKKTMACRIPLQIAWYNFLCCNSSLKENILLYEPIQLEVIHSMLKEQSGCNFHLEELITFLDKKCITFRTSQWQGARKKRKKANIKKST